MKAVRGVFTALIALIAANVCAQTGDNVLVVVNGSSVDSRRVGSAYASARSIAERQVIEISASTAESVERAEYLKTIEEPIGAWLRRHSMQDEVLYIVLTKGVPLRILGTPGVQGTGASVDSELALLYRKLVGWDAAPTGRIANPYFLADRPIGEARRFTRHNSDGYLVTRLDGFEEQDALALIGRAQRASIDGDVILDQRGSTALIGDRWLEAAAANTDAVRRGRSALETTSAPAASPNPVLGYYSWGSNDPANRRRQTGLRFVPGAIGGMFVSTDGRTFTPPPDDWAPGESTRRGGLFGSGSQSLAGDLIREGITGVSAHVDEPFLDATVRPQILFPAYLSGFTLAESFYLAMPFLSWQTIVIGDPLAAPFAARQLTDAEIHNGLDEATGLPAIFASRRLDVLARTGLNRQALIHLLRAEALANQGRDAETEAPLLQAVALEPRLTVAESRLALLYEAAGQHDKARTRYERLLAAGPNNPVALNNLAYSLARDGADLDRALTLADRAYRLSKASPIISDTLGWIHHLRGDHAAARPLVEAAASALPDNVDVLVHAAVVRAALGDATGAERALEAARKIDARVDDRPEVKSLDLPGRR
jgi:uncharacterized protein (TIGR03790 family)